MLKADYGGVLKFGCCLLQFKWLEFHFSLLYTSISSFLAILQLAQMELLVNSASRVPLQKFGRGCNALLSVSLMGCRRRCSARFSRTCVELKRC